MAYSKYGNKFTKYAGDIYHSKAEADYSKLLNEMLERGELLKIDRQRVFKLPNASFQSKRPLEYRADFVVTDAKGKEWIVEFKGKLERSSLYKMAYCEFVHGVKIKLVRNSGLDKFDTSFFNT